MNAPIVIIISSTNVSVVQNPGGTTGPEWSVSTDAKIAPEPTTMMVIIAMVVINVYAA